MCLIDAFDWCVCFVWLMCVIDVFDWCVWLMCLIDVCDWCVRLMCLIDVSELLNYWWSEKKRHFEIFSIFARSTTFRFVTKIFWRHVFWKIFYIFSRKNLFGKFWLQIRKLSIGQKSKKSRSDFFLTPSIEDFKHNHNNQDLNVPTFNTACHYTKSRNALKSLQKVIHIPLLKKQWSVDQ